MRYNGVTKTVISVMIVFALVLGGLPLQSAADDGSIQYFDDEAIENGSDQETVETVEVTEAGEEYPESVLGEVVDMDEGPVIRGVVCIPDDPESFSGTFAIEDGKLYYYNENGENPKNTWVEDGGKRFYASKGGYLCTDRIVTFTYNDEQGFGRHEKGDMGFKAMYCFGNDGTVQSGIVNCGGKYYYCDPEKDDRVRVSDWVEVGGKRYFASSDGAFYTNVFITFGPDRKYYVGSDGSVQTGIIYTGGKYYYADPENDDIIRLSDWVESGGRYYFASSDGSFYVRTFISFGSDKYYVGAQGETINGMFSVGGKYYYGDPEQRGKIVTNRWVEQGGKRYFASKDGSFYTETMISFGSDTKYYMGVDGSVQTGIIKYNSSYYYGDPNDQGKIAMSRWVETGGHKYFASSDGSFYTNEFIHFGDTYYYMNEYGQVTLKPFVIKGITITPDPVTGVITKEEYDKLTDLRSPLPYSDYVLVDIPTQTLRYYVNGYESLFTYVVTGNTYKTPTPTGTFYLNGGKTQNATLIGEDYETFVYYWMPFIGGAYGMHDATWRSSFGGTIYIGNGSHGCINMPYDKAQELYFMIPVGTMIIIR